tara:strand:+ start:2887 stop:3258 length:372 start_codon:yes stop_codon:yes gene_type:complete
MKKEFKDSEFPICFLNVPTGIYTAYTFNGVMINLNPKKGHIFKSLYHQKHQTEHTYLKEIEYIFNHKIANVQINQQITQSRFDELIDKTINQIFGSDENRNFLPTLKEVKESQKFRYMQSNNI